MDERLDRVMGELLRAREIENDRRALQERPRLTEFQSRLLMLAIFRELQALRESRFRLDRGRVVRLLLLRHCGR